jgi:hypothetical protein
MRRSFVILVLAGSLASAPSSLFDPLWTYLSSLWGGSASAKIGCELDPDGRCLIAPKAGCEMDPSGGCQPAPQPTSEAGCEWDPSGRCIPGS